MFNVVSTSKKIQIIAYHLNLIDLPFIRLLRKFSLEKFTNQLERIYKPQPQTGKEQRTKLIFGQSATSNVVSKLTAWNGAKSNHFIISIVWPGAPSPLSFSRNILTSRRCRVRCFHDWKKAPYPRPAGWNGRPKRPKVQRDEIIPNGGEGLVCFSLGGRCTVLFFQTLKS